ncbi:unnamed protein product [Adineta steineri]|uniref:Leucine-rich repeat-containing protein 27 n=1 Tax=Adineta steineri TaxID=433720 RepID=A0A819PQQ1_9BILA|nr:unnamed protein product [Adineta steineri]CAF4017079.1 unnamed protein product [Adineta steineri]
MTTNDIEVQADLVENGEEYDNKSLSNCDDLNELSLSQSPELNQENNDEEEEEERIQTEDFPDDLYDQIDDNLHINETQEDSALIEFITKAQHEDCNCLDLSKKTISQFPTLLLYFPSLQYLYLEGNQLKKLPDDLFLQLPYLKWLDLRNNQITELPTDGLAKYTSLKSLLLGGNLIRTLPYELGTIKSLSSLNLDGNPLVDPPAEIIKQGLKAIQQYLHDEFIRQPKSSYEENDPNDDIYYEDHDADIVPDVWASDDDEKNNNQRQVKRKIKTIAKQNNQPVKTKSDDPVGDAFAARALEEQRLIRLKHRNIKINEQLEKIKSKELLHEWKEDYRSSQQQLRRKHLVKGRDYPEAVRQAPFGIDPNYIHVMDKDQQEMIERAVKYESRRNRSPESAMQEEENRLIRDRQIQARIREITGKMLARRNLPRGNASEEKHQAEFELRELKKLQAEVRQRRTQINTRFKAYTGDVKAHKRL